MKDNSIQRDVKQLLCVAAITIVVVFAIMRCISAYLLYQAVEQNDPRTIAFVAKWDKASLSQFGIDFESPLTRAVNQNAKEAYTALLENCVNPNRIGFRGYNLILLAATKSDPSWLRIAIRYGGDPSIDHQGLLSRRITPLFAAIESDSVECVKVLVDECNVDIHQIQDDQDALVTAAFAGHHDIVLHLLKSGANFRRKTHQYISFAFAIKQYHVRDYIRDVDKQELQAVIDWLKEQGVEYDKPKRDGNTWVY